MSSVDRPTLTISRELLEGLVANWERKSGGRAGSPNHGHKIAGIWDSDNGKLAGKPCAECALYDQAREALAAPVDRPALAGAQDERAAFEAWRRRTTKFKNSDDAVALNGFGDDAEYENSYTRTAWSAWQARAALSGPTEGPMIDMTPPATRRDRWMYEQGRLAERDPRTHVDAMCALIKAADDAAADKDYMLDSDDCISVLRGTWKGPLANDCPPKPSGPTEGSEPVAMIGRDWQIFWEGDGPIDGIVKRHGLKIGSRLYATPAAASQDAKDALRDLHSKVKQSVTRREPISGQYFSYVKQDDVLAMIENALASMAAQGGEHA